MGKPLQETVIFRRYRRMKGGRVLDAWEYGHKAWPFHLRRRKRTRKHRPKG